MAAASVLEPGVWGVLATPFAGAALEVDEESLAREVAHYRALPATGVVALGVFGEAAKLDADEQIRVLRVVEQAAEGLPIIAGLSARATAPAIEQARHACRAAGDALAGLMVQVHSSDPSVLAAHFRAISAATGRGIVVQDYPLSSGVRIGQGVLAEVVAGCDVAIAVKSESPPTPSAIAALATQLDVPVFGGLGGVGLVDELVAGAAGAMTGFSHPEGLRAAIRGFHDGGFQAARDAFAPWLPLVNFEAQPGIGLAVRKASLHRRGLLTEPTIRPPGQHMPDSLSRPLDQHLAAVQELMD